MRVRGNFYHSWELGRELHCPWDLCPSGRRVSSRPPSRRGCSGLGRSCFDAAMCDSCRMAQGRHHTKQRPCLPQSYPPFVNCRTGSCGYSRGFVWPWESRCCQSRPPHIILEPQERRGELHRLHPFRHLLPPWVQATILCEQILVSFGWPLLTRMLQVLGEVSRPKRIFAKATTSAMVLVIFLYIMVNVAFV
jgi:hypothetical protein